MGGLGLAPLVFPSLSPPRIMSFQQAKHHVSVGDRGAGLLKVSALDFVSRGSGSVILGNNI